VIVGGTFNPIHNGHILALHALYDSGHFDEIWLMPSGTPPFKKNEKQSKAHRLQMCRLIQQELEFVKVSELEIVSDDVAYTYKTWTQLSRNHPEDTFYWMIGDDHVFHIEQWKHSQDLLRDVSLVLVNRGGYDPKAVDKQCAYLKETYHAQILQVSMPKIEISSTRIRERVCNQQSIVGYTPQSIIDYIEQHNLYGGNPCK